MLYQLIRKIQVNVAAFLILVDNGMGLIQNCLHFIIVIQLLNFHLFNYNLRFQTIQEKQLYSLNIIHDKHQMVLLLLRQTF